MNAACCAPFAAFCQAKREAQLLLVIDQFEELFTLVEDEKQRLHFLDSLLVAAQRAAQPTARRGHPARRLL